MWAGLAWGTDGHLPLLTSGSIALALAAARRPLAVPGSAYAVAVTGSGRRGGQAPDAPFPHDRVSSDSCIRACSGGPGVSTYP